MNTMQLGYNLEPNLSLDLEITLSPRQIQMLKTLQLTYQELLENMREESESNVFLEIEKEDRLIEYLRALGPNKKTRGKIDSEEFPGMDNLKETRETLEESLKQQASLEELSSPLDGILNQLIENVDDNGYLIAYDKLKTELIQKFKVNEATIDEMLEVLQSFDPDGVGARTLKECLMLQVNNYQFDNPALEQVVLKCIDEHLEELADQAFVKISESMGITEEGVRHIALFVKENLTPYPGARFGEATGEVIPSFSLDESNEGVKITNLEETYGPKVGISNQYLKMLEDPKTDAPTIDFLRDKLRSAKDTIENYQNRQNMINKMIKLIVAEQEVFVSKGKAWLKPLLQKELAEQLGVHPSTVSRALSGKFVQTPQGLFPIKFLCARGHSGHSSHHLKARLVALVAAEDKSNPLTDEQISDIFSTENIGLGRRTVASYRQHLGIGNVKERTRK